MPMRNKKSVSEKKNNKANKSEKKVGFFKRLKNGIINIKKELKRVTWPDKLKLRLNTTTVLIIILLVAVMVFLFDFIINFILSNTGFYTVKNKAAQPANNTPAITETASTQVSDSTVVQVDTTTVTTAKAN